MYLFFFVKIPNGNEKMRFLFLLIIILFQWRKCKTQYSRKRSRVLYNNRNKRLFIVLLIYYVKRNMSKTFIKSSLYRRGKKKCFDDFFSKDYFGYCQWKSKQSSMKPNKWFNWIGTIHFQIYCKRKIN